MRVAVPPPAHSGGGPSMTSTKPHDQPTIVSSATTSTSSPSQQHGPRSSSSLTTTATKVMIQGNSISTTRSIGGGGLVGDTPFSFNDNALLHSLLFDICMATAPTPAPSSSSNTTTPTQNNSSSPLSTTAAISTIADAERQLASYLQLTLPHGNTAVRAAAAAAVVPSPQQGGGADAAPLRHELASSITHAQKLVTMYPHLGMNTGSKTASHNHKSKSTDNSGVGGGDGAAPPAYVLAEARRVLEGITACPMDPSLAMFRTGGGGHHHPSHGGDVSGSFAFSDGGTGGGLFTTPSGDNNTTSHSPSTMSLAPSQLAVLKKLAAYAVWGFAKDASSTTTASKDQHQQGGGPTSSVWQQVYRICRLHLSHTMPLLAARLRDLNRRVGQAAITDPDQQRRVSSASEAASNAATQGSGATSSISQMVNQLATPYPVSGAQQHAQRQMLTDVLQRLHNTVGDGGGTAAVSGVADSREELLLHRNAMLQAENDALRNLLAASGGVPHARGGGTGSPTNVTNKGVVTTPTTTTTTNNTDSKVADGWTSFAAAHTVLVKQLYETTAALEVATRKIEDLTRASSSAQNSN